MKIFKTRYKYGIGMKILSIDIGGVCTLPQGTEIADLSIYYLNDFTESKIESCDLHHNNQYCVHLPKHPTNVAP